MALVHNVTLLKNTVVMYVVFHYSLIASVLTPYIRVWISPVSAVNVTDKGLRIVHASSDYFYLVTINLFLNCLPI